MKIKTQFVFTHSPDMILKAIENPKDPIIFHLSDDERIELITLAEMCVGANLDPHNEKELAQAVSYAEADLSSRRRFYSKGVAFQRAVLCFPIHKGAGLREKHELHAHCERNNNPL